jgi:hypothetical protein
VQVRLPGRPRLDGSYPTTQAQCGYCDGRGTVVSEEESEAAKRELDDAIRRYYDQVAPAERVTGWALVTHKSSPALDAAGRSTVGELTPTGQPWPLTLGMLHAVTASYAGGGQ